MRVNHSGEVAAQALYQGQLVFEKDLNLIKYFLKASDEEADHLRWTSSQLTKLDSHESYFNVLWYIGAFFVGATASLTGEKSIGFLAETERQVADHLSGHLSRLPKNDKSSRLVLESMLNDETEHASWAENSKDFKELPDKLKNLMQAGSKVMIFISHKI
jgi:ubiquinone biosynthesis monooxygenase Coq7